MIVSPLRVEVLGAARLVTPAGATPLERRRAALLAYLALTFVYGIFVSVGSLILEEIELQRFPRARDLAILALIAVLENFGYRQISNLWRVQGFWQYLRGKQGWGTMTRVGFKRT